MTWDPQDAPEHIYCAHCDVEISEPFYILDCRGENRDCVVCASCAKEEGE